METLEEAGNDHKIAAASMFLIVFINHFSVLFYCHLEIYVILGCFGRLKGEC